MLSKLIFVVAAFLAVGQTMAHGSHDHDHDHSGETAVQVLTEDNFHSTVKDQPLTLVEFFAPWCGHCKNLAPHYAEASVKLRDDESIAKLASVDCTVEKSLCEEFGVKGFPTLKVFTPSTMSSPADYKGGRTAKDIVNYMVKQSEPAFVEVSDAVAGEKFLTTNPTSVKFVGVFNSLSDDSAASFKEVAQQLRNDYSFALSSDSSFFPNVASSKPSITVIKSDGETASLTEEPFTVASINQFVQAEAFPLFGEIGPENYAKYVERGLPLTWVFYDPSDASLEEQTRIITEAARSVKGQISVVKLDGVKWAEHMKSFDLPNKLPGLVIEDRDTGRKFHFPADTELTTESLTKHFQGFLDGSIQPHMKSEAAPTDNDGPVRVIVGSTFDDEVINNEKDVFVEFYAPWCGHCKNLAPKWEELGEIFADNNDVVIAKVDATANDTPARVEGFPTLFFYPKGAKESPLRYEGDRTPHAMAEWVRAHGGTFGNAGHDDL